MTRALSLYKKYSQDQLVRMQADLCLDPANANITGSCALYNDKTSKMLDDIAYAITYHLEDTRKAAGNPVPTNGYSGRQTNKRR